MAATLRSGYLIDGIDISEASLATAARKGGYRKLRALNIEENPFPVSFDQHDVLVCAGVLSDLEEFEHLSHEWGRIGRLGGVGAFSHRCNMWDSGY